MGLHQSKIDRGKEALGTCAATEPVELTPDMAAFRNELVEGIRAMRGAGLIDIYAEGGEA